MHAKYNVEPRILRCAERWALGEYEVTVNVNRSGGSVGCGLLAILTGIAVAASVPIFGPAAVGIVLAVPLLIVAMLMAVGSPGPAFSNETTKDVLAGWGFALAIVLVVAVLGFPVYTDPESIYAFGYVMLLGAAFAAWGIHGIIAESPKYIYVFSGGFITTVRRGLRRRPVAFSYGRLRIMSAEETSVPVVLADDGTAFPLESLPKEVRQRVEAGGTSRE
jgi:hypothetical protein